ncbi:Dual specificity mitogen-activated protein kinase kinase 5 [Crotalus adamanteus]|uniref:Dual specificity mitogen-activated protein kinase kinase 5 n=1 Tax=Crotalus adamanteus TaxID=8729 RepID=A0AAW1AW94_CROAD
MNPGRQRARGPRRTRGSRLVESALGPPRPAASSLGELLSRLKRGEEVTLLDVTGTQLAEKDLGALARGRGLGIRDDGGPRLLTPALGGADPGCQVARGRREGSPRGGKACASLASACYLDEDSANEERGARGSSTPPPHGGGGSPRVELRGGPPPAQSAAAGLPAASFQQPPPSLPADNFQDQMKRELAYREEMVQQLQIVRDTLCNELDQERKARYAIQQKLKGGWQPLRQSAQGQRRRRSDTRKLAGIVPGPAKRPNGELRHPRPLAEPSGPERDSGWPPLARRACWPLNAPA